MCQKIKGGIFILLPERKYIFTYEDYLYVTGQFEELEKIRQENKEILYDIDEEEYTKLKEEEAQYRLVTPKDKKHDKIFKEILQDEKEMAQFIDEFVLNGFDGELELQNGEYITKNKKGRQTDIIYKVKEKDIYYLIEHQTKIDFTMSFRMLEYSMEITRRAIKDKKCNNKEYRYPLVIPIVLYTGNRKWTANTKYYDSVTKAENNDFKGLDIEYKLIDINEFEMDELLDKNTKLRNAMALEKCKNPEEVFECFNKIAKKSKSIEETYEIADILLFLYDKIEIEKLKQILKDIEESEEENMSTIQERMRDWFNDAYEKHIWADKVIKEAEEREKKAINDGMTKGMEKGMQQGMAQAISQTVKRMLKINLTDDIIQQATGIKTKELEKIKRQVQC